MPELTPQNTEHKRRVRYKGTHPRRFEEKYKELHVDKYADDVQKVISRGQTPAGTHRPICVKEILDILDLKPGKIGVDATLGYGGHTQEILQKILPDGKVYGLDVDPLELPKTEARLRNLGFTENNFIARRMNFAGLPQLINESRCLFDFFLADLGVSSMQIDTPDRGFSFKLDGPLDLRLNPNRGSPVSSILKTLNSEELTTIFHDFADEPYCHVIADAICKYDGPVTTTKQLASIIHGALTQRRNVNPDDIKKSQQRVFQALRIYINNEYGVLDQLLTLLPSCLNPGARVAFLTFHSGEDRRVKKSFQDGLRNGIYSDIAPTPIRPANEEKRSNPRSSCAKLRWAIKR